jgi:hypothetical protein
LAFEFFYRFEKILFHNGAPEEVSLVRISNFKLQIISNFKSQISNQIRES